MPVAARAERVVEVREQAERAEGDEADDPDPRPAHATPCRAAAPSASDTTTMPMTSAALSFVPNSETARSFSDAAKRSMNCVPTAVISDGPEPARPHTSSLTPSATPAATTPAIAPSAGAAGGPLGGGDGSALSRLERSVDDSHGDDGTPASGPAGVASRETDAKLARRPGAGRATAGRTVTARDGRTIRRSAGARRRRRADGPRGRRHVPAARRAAGRTRRPTAPERWPGCADHTPDLVVLDIMLPGTDGLTILRQLRADGSRSR